jgi:endonuclease/exonuclease/phosphatase family metal-dependent hydrolase
MIRRMSEATGVAAAGLRVATLNLFGVRADWAGRRDVVRAGFAELEPDLVSLQEVIKTSDSDQARAVLGDDYYFAHHNVRLPDGQGDSIASRWPIATVQQVDVPSRHPGVGRLSSTLLARIDAPPPIGPVLVVNHATAFQLDREADREHQAVAIADFLEREVATHKAHVIVAGDLNAHPDAACIRYWTGAQSLNGTSVCYRDAWATLHPGNAGHTFTPENTLTVTAEDGEWELEPGRRIDYILVRCDGPGPTLRIESCRIIFDRPSNDIWASDHFGVTADLSALTPTGPSTPNWL